VALASGGDDDEGGSASSDSGAVVVGGTFSVGESIEVELGTRGATASLVVASSDGEVEISAEPLDEQDIVLTYEASDGSAAASCNATDGGGAGEVETCALTIPADDIATVRVAPYTPSSAHGVVHLNARSTGTAPAPPEPAPDQTDPATEATEPAPEPTDAPEPEPAGPIEAGAISLGDEVEVELGDEGTFVALSGTSPDESFEVSVTPFGGQDVMLSVVAADGSVVEGCADVDNAGGGDPETCQFAAGVDGGLWILVRPYDASDAGGSVGILARGTGSGAPSPVDPGVVLDDLGVAPWDEAGDSAQPEMFTCGGLYPTDSYDGHLQVWLSSETGFKAYGSTLVFDSGASAQDYMSTFAGEYQPGCTNTFDDGTSFVWDSLFVDDAGGIGLEYSVYDGDGNYVYSGREYVASAGNVVVDVSCDGGGSECDDLFAAAADRLFEVAG
jgi:hypothetical protein